MQKKNIVLIFLLSIFLGLDAFAGVTPIEITNEVPLPTIAVIGMSNEVENEEWQDERVGLGLRVILSQLFFDSGEFNMLEEKSDIRKKLNEFASAIWTMNEKDYDFNQTIDSLAIFDADFAAYGRVIYFGKPRSKMSFGPMHMNKRTVIIKVEVILEDLATGKKIKENEEGKSSTKAGSVLFQFREDNVEWDKTNIGNAIQKALNKAVEKVMKKYKKEYR